MDFKIDPEIQALLTPLSSEEFDQLERNILDGLHVDPLVIIKIGRELILGDGHNRHSICLKHGIEFETRVKEMPSREAAIQWVIDNQLGRRNLTDERRAYYRGKEYLSKKQQHVGEKVSDGQNVHPGETVAKTVAETVMPNSPRLLTLLHPQSKKPYCPAIPARRNPSPMEWFPFSAELAPARARSRTASNAPK
jgi:hypothetical protein